MTRVFGMYRMANSMALLDAAHPQGRARQGRRRPRLRQLLAGTPTCRPATRWSPASRRSSSTSTPSSTRKTRRRLGHELDHHQDARRALADRGAPQGHARRRHRLRVLGHRQQGATTSIVVRPGTTPALALGLAQRDPAREALRRRLRAAWTDLPMLVRMDTLKYLRAQRGLRRRRRRRSRTRRTSWPRARRSRPPGSSATCSSPSKLRDEWGDYVWWDAGGQGAASHSRATRWARSRRSATRCSRARSRSRSTDGKKVRCRPVFDLVQEYAAHFDPKTVEELTWAPAAAVESAGARTSPSSPARRSSPSAWGRTSSSTTTTRTATIFLLAALTGNVGKIGGNVGSYAGNYRVGALQRRAAVHQREPVRPRAGPGQAGAAEAVLEGRVGALLQPRGPLRCEVGKKTAHRLDAHPHARPSRCGSPTPTRSSAT